MPVMDYGNLPSPSPTPTQFPTHRRRLNREERRDILILRRLGYTYQAIAKHLNVSQRAVQYTCESNSCDPKHRPGRNSKLTTEQVDEIEAFIAASRGKLNLSYKKIIEEMKLDVKQDCVRRALQKRGYSRGVGSWPPHRIGGDSGGIGQVGQFSNHETNPPIEFTPSLPQPTTYRAQSTVIQYEPTVTGQLPTSNSHPAFTRYPSPPAHYLYHNPAGPEPSPAPVPHHQYYQGQVIPPQYNSTAYNYASTTLERNPALYQSSSVPFHQQPAPRAPPYYHTSHDYRPAIHEYGPVHLNLPPALPEYRRALSEYCPSLIDGRTVVVPTLRIQPDPVDQKYSNFTEFRSASGSPALRQDQNTLDISSASGGSRSSSGYSTPVTIPDDFSGARYSASVHTKVAHFKPDPGA